MSTKINAAQLDLVASELEAAGTASRQLSIKAGAVIESKLGFTFVVVSIPASSFVFDSTRSNYTLSQAASANANVSEFAILSRNGVDELTKVSTTAAADEFSLSGTTLSVHGDITASGATFKLRYVVGTASGDAGASGNLVWLGTVPQDPAHAKSDYFGAASLDTKWTVWDEDAVATVTVGGGDLEIIQTSHVGDSVSGILQTVPSAAQFAITADLTMASRVAGTGASVMLLVGDDLISSPASAAFIEIEANLLAGPDRDINIVSWTDYNTSTTQHVTANDLGLNVRYLRIFVDDTANTFAFLVSTDGRAWVQIGLVTQAASTVTGDAVVMGLGLNNNNTVADLKLISRMFRVDETTDPFLPVGGYVGTSVPATVQDGPNDVVVSGGNTVNLYGWEDRRVVLTKAEVMSIVPATVGAYTFALAKDPLGTPANMLSAATFDMTSLVAGVVTSVPLTSTVDDRTLVAGDLWRAQFDSDNAGLDAAGVYYSLTWLVL